MRCQCLHVRYARIAGHLSIAEAHVREVRRVADRTARSIGDVRGNLGRVGVDMVCARVGPIEGLRVLDGNVDSGLSDEPLGHIQRREPGLQT